MFTASHRSVSCPRCQRLCQVAVLSCSACFVPHSIQPLRGPSLVNIDPSVQIDVTTTTTTEASVCKQDTCQAAYSKHAGRFVTASFTWAVESIRPAEIKLIPMPWFVRHMRLTAPKGTKRKRVHLAINRGNWRLAAVTMPRRCWDKVVVKRHPWFNQHGHGNLPSCMQQSCGPYEYSAMRRNLDFGACYLIN